MEELLLCFEVVKKQWKTFLSFFFGFWFGLDFFEIVCDDSDFGEEVRRSLDSFTSVMEEDLLLYSKS